MAEHFPDVVRMIVEDGHEVASHGYSHQVHEAFDVLDYKTQVEHLNKSRKLLEDITGTAVNSFRAPALRVNTHTARALAETGFLTDSSVASQRFDMFMSFGGVKKLKWLTAPRLPYRTRHDNLFRKGTGKIVEVPLTALGLPYVGTTMRLFPFITRVQRNLLHAENTINCKPIVFDVHPNEFINEETENRIIERRSGNFFRYLFTDLIRGKLKVKNLGKSAIPLYEKELEFYRQRGYTFLTVNDYCKKTGLI
jgi:peptidoglycan/xylan/chitin deacetylase (PgdA/CDA1 family)